MHDNYGFVDGDVFFQSRFVIMDLAPILLRSSSTFLCNYLLHF